MRKLFERMLDLSVGPTRTTQCESERSWRRMLLPFWLVVATIAILVTIKFAPRFSDLSEHDLLVLILISIWLRGR